MPVTIGWVEIGDGVFVRRYPFLRQNIGVVVGADGVLVIDTRATARLAEEIRTDLRAVTPLPVTVVVNTHAHWDHCFGNRTFRPSVIWGHEGCARFLEANIDRQRAVAVEEDPSLAADVGAVVVDPPDRTFAERATVTFGGRTVEFSHLGRGHTDHDIVVVVPGTGVLFAGDLIESDSPPWFGDAFPLEWAATVRALGDLGAETIVPGHGRVVDPAFVAAQAAEIEAIVSLARRIDEGELSMGQAQELAPWDPDEARLALERALAQLRGEFV